VRYSLQHPDPAALYAQVVTEPKASAYVGSVYTDIRYELTAESKTLPAEQAERPARPEPKKTLQ